MPIQSEFKDSQLSTDSDLVPIQYQSNTNPSSIGVNPEPIRPYPTPTWPKSYVNPTPIQHQSTINPSQSDDKSGQSNLVPIHSNLLPKRCQYGSNPSRSDANPVPIHPNLLPTRCISGANPMPIKRQPFPNGYRSISHSSPIQFQSIANPVPISSHSM